MGLGECPLPPLREKEMAVSCSPVLTRPPLSGCTPICSHTTAGSWGGAGERSVR